MKCAVLGAGAWGTALANVLAENGHDTCVWAFEPDVADAIQTGHEPCTSLLYIIVSKLLTCFPDILNL